MAFLLFASLLLPLSFAYPGQEIQSRQSLVCNFIGYDLGIKAYNYANDTAIANLDACSRRCLAESPCKSFAFDSGSCLLYNLTTYVTTSFSVEQLIEQRTGPKMPGQIQAAHTSSTTEAVISQLQWSNKQCRDQTQIQVPPLQQLPLLPLLLLPCPQHLAQLKELRRHQVPH